MAMTVTVEKITPAKAEKILNRNTCNRHLRSGVVERYSADMKTGNWTTCASPIVIYDNGELADGQHRLYAIIESGTTQTFIVVRDLDRKAGLNIDVGLTRTLVDNARISGVNTDLSNRLLAVTRAMALGSRSFSGNTVASNALKLALVDEYGEAARWAIANGPHGKQFSHSLVLGAIARAWYYEEDKARLVSFGEVLGKGFMADERDSAAIALRNHLLVVSATGFGHQDVWRDTFLKTQNAIKYFMRRRKLTVIRGVKDETYPLPETKAQKKVA